MEKKISSEEQRKIWGEITARAWEDKKFKERLIAHPVEVLKEYGMPIPNGMHIKIQEDGKMVRNLVLKEKPEGMSNADLKRLAAAFEGPDLL